VSGDAVINMRTAGPPDGAADAGGAPRFPRSGGPIRDAVAQHGWAATPLGPLDAWPQSLKTAVELCLAMPGASAVWWGPALVQIPNDAAMALFGGDALGQPAQHFWAAAWDRIAAGLAVIGVDRRAGGAESASTAPAPAAPAPGFSYAALRNEAGEIAGAFVTVADGAADLRLAVERAQLVRMYEQAPGAIALIGGPDHHYVTVNAAHRRLFARDLRGMAAADAHPELFRDGLGSALAQVAQTGKPARLNGVRLALPGAEPVYLDIALQPMPGADGTDSIFLIANDVTEHVRTRRAAEEDRSRLHALADHLPGVIVYQMEINPDLSGRRFTFISANCEALSGVPAAAALADPMALMGGILPEDMVRLYHEELAVIASGTGLETEVRTDRGDGIRHVQVRTQPRAAIDGRLLFDGMLIDVTEQRRTEAALRDSEARFRLLANVVPSFIWFADARGVIHFINDRWYEYSGQTPEVALAHGWFDAVHPDDAPVISAVWRRTLAEGSSYMGECRYRRHDGAYRWYVARAEPLRDASGRITAWCGCSTDVHDLKCAEEAVQASEERLRAITDAMPALISYIDREHRFRFVNQAYQRWFDRPVADILGSHSRDVLGDDMYRERLPRMLEAFAGQAVAYESPFVQGPQARSTIVQHIPHLDAEGAVLGVYTLVQDVTELKRIEAELRDSRDRLQAVLDAAPAAILIAEDPSCAHIVGNRVATELMGLPAGANLSKHAPDSDVGHVRVLDVNGGEVRPEDLPVQRATRGETLTMHEEQLVFDDGRRVHLLGNAAPLRNPDGGVRGAVCALIDITERKRAEERQKLLIDELNHRVKNTLAVVQGIAQLSFRDADIDPAVRAAFEGRLAALATAHELLTRGNWSPAPISEVLGGTLSGLGVAADSLSLAGPHVLLPPKTAVSIAIAAHELGTNALKYGALSVAGGRILIDWAVAAGQLSLVWREQGGPPVAPPRRRGFGTRLIERGLAAELGGTVEIAFLPEGVVCRIDAPAP
jgi:PAS domain S-box-containing protein